MMNARLPGFLTLLVGAAIIIAFLPSSALAHDSYYWFNPIGWDNHADIDYKIDASIPGSAGSAFEDRIHSSVGRWNSQCCIGTFHFDDVGNGDRAFNDPCNWKEDATDVWVFHAEIGIPGVVGENFHCTVYHQQQDYTDIHSGRVTFDEDYTWYTGDDGNPPAGQYSVADVAVHEFGHDTGTFKGGNATEGTSGGHWVPAPSTMCASGGAESDWTMCGPTFDGEGYKIPLEPHDIDTFQDFY
jgi:hypothetical protein